MNKKANPLYGMRAKLLSAVSMLLVAVIMVISSTYAWFTLSTAPEVKGISTAIGANGALEMALLTGTNGHVIEPQNGQAPEEMEYRNLYWGNLVDVSKDSVYGSSSITLLPSTLNGLTMSSAGVYSGKLNLTTMLATPSYGTDGRLDKLEANTVTGTYDGTSFIQNDAFGFRAVGVSSGMSERELAYRNAKATASTFANTAKTLAAASLEANGSTLANLVVKKATDEKGTAKYTLNDVNALKQIVDSLLGTDATKTDGVLENIEAAYIQYIISYAAVTNAQNGAAWTALKAEADSGKSLSEIYTKYTTEYDVALPTEIDTILKKLYGTTEDGNVVKGTFDNVEEAKSLLDAIVADVAAGTIENGEDIPWERISLPLNLLANSNAMTVNGWTSSQIKADMNGFVQKVSNDGMKVTVAMTTGGGVYADIADHCGNYSASITVDVVYGSLTLEGVSARMNTTTTVTPIHYLSQVANKVNSTAFVEDAGASSTKPLTEFYGYIIDLAFRTNAADSHLLLQTAPKDRIYSDNAENNEFTWGGGSTMSFTSTTTSFNTTMMKSLMGNIKVVFFDTTTGDILANAKLDTTNAKVTGSGVEAALYLVDANGNLITNQADAKIKALGQNTRATVSALVFLEGATIQNKDVAAEAAASMTGSLNLQFSSSATLVPAEYGDYHVKGEATTAANS